MGPFCFLYVHDLCSVTDLSLMFADDTNIFATGYFPVLVANDVTATLKNINQWFSANLLSRNLNKTRMIFSKEKHLANNITITLNGVTLNRVSETKFLGILLTKNDLRWNKQVDTVINQPITNQ